MDLKAEKGGRANEAGAALAPRASAAPRNKAGGISLAAGLAGFLLAELQPWLDLGSVALFGGLTLKGLVSAFFEASVVGALADWFAVTALFKNPLGLKLPHTDIIAKSKNALARAVPRFLSGFVSQGAIEAELGRVDFASRIADALEAGPTRDGIHAFLRDRASEFLKAYGGSGEGRAEALRGFVSGALRFVAERADAPAAAAGLLRWARKERFDERAIDMAAEWLREGIGRNRVKLVKILTPLLKQNSGWQGLFMGPGTVERALAGIQATLTEIKTDKTNEARRFIVAALSDTADRLAGEAPDPAGDRAKLTAAFRDALADPQFAAAVSGFVGKLLSTLGGDLASSEGEAIRALVRIEDALASRLRSDEGARAGVNAAAASILAAVIERGRIVQGLTEYLAGLLMATDDRLFVRRIEDAVWNDLQYIRVNGAVVGGLVGLLIALAKAALAGA
jgi:uncharacterized membrane-anchored protein YjiN (DUF445 family)